MSTDTQAVEEVVALVGVEVFTVWSTDAELVLAEDDTVEGLFVVKLLGWPDDNV